MSTNEVKSSEPCPICLLQNKNPSSPLINRPGQFYTTCLSGGHKFEDTDELNMFRAQARSKYPNLYASLAPTKPAAADPAILASQDIVISAEVKKTIEDITGVTFTGAGDFKGAMIAYVQDNKDKEEEIKSLRAKLAQGGGARSGGTSMGLRPITLRPDQMIITLPEWAIDGGIAQNAEHDGVSPEEWVNTQFEGWLEQFFTTSVPGRGR